MNRLAFCIQGDAMSPTLHNEDVVICSELSILDELREQELYAVITRTGSVLVKRLSSIRRNHQGQITQLKWVNDNYPHRVDVLHRRDIRQILCVQQRLSVSA